MGMKTKENLFKLRLSWSYRAVFFITIYFIGWFQSNIFITIYFIGWLQSNMFVTVYFIGELIVCLTGASCGIVCGYRQNSFYLKTGKDNTEGPTLCYNGKM
jgi:hypothetical protein